MGWGVEGLFELVLEEGSQCERDELLILKEQVDSQGQGGKADHDDEDQDREDGEHAFPSRLGQLGVETFEHEVCVESIRGGRLCQTESEAVAGRRVIRSCGRAGNDAGAPRAVLSGVSRGRRGLRRRALRV